MTTTVIVEYDRRKNKNKSSFFLHSEEKCGRTEW
jgi:hypothetical protein